LSSITTALPSQPVRAFDYTFYDNGLLDTELDTVGGATVQRQHFYDGLNRIEAIVEISGPGAVQNTGFPYDDYGNLTQSDGATISFLPNKPHLVNTVGGTQYLYDAAGNVSERTGTTVPGGKQTFDYTSFDLPRRIVTGLTPNEETTLFEYTADQERIVQRNSEADLHFVAGLYQRKLTPTGWGNEERFRIMVGGRVLGEIVRVDGTDETLYFHEDRLGSVKTVTDGSGAIVHQSFDTFGGTGTAPGPTRLGFTGHEHDRDLGLIDMQGRVYDPLAGRFLTPDPVTQAPFFSQGLNRYAYAFNDPVNNTDPTGLMSTDQGGELAHVWAMAMPFLQVGGQAIGLGFLSPSASVNVGVSLYTGAYWDGAVPDQAPTTVQTLGAPAPTSSGSGLGRTDAIGQNKGGLLQAQGRPPELSLFNPNLGALACGPATQVCIRIAQAAMNSPAGQAAQRAAQHYGQRAADLARRYGPRVADAASRLGSWLVDKVGARAAPNLTVTFGRNANQIEHAFRHTDKLGLSRAAVQDAVQKHLPSVVDKIPSGSPLNQVIEVGGKQIQYSAFRLPDGSINVGRIHGVP
jgi:RHS repeat-associated protein